MKLIPLTQGVFTIIDDEDLELVAKHTWSAKASGNGRIKKLYAVTSVTENGQERRVPLHRLIIPGCQYVDHKNGITTDNRRENLRPANGSQNGANAIRTAGASGFIGVQQMRGGKFRAKICHNYKSRSLGTFDTAEEAARSRDKAAVELFGEFAFLNFPTIRPEAFI